MPEEKEESVLEIRVAYGDLLLPFVPKAIAYSALQQSYSDDYVNSVVGEEGIDQGAALMILSNAKRNIIQDPAQVATMVYDMLRKSGEVYPINNFVYNDMYLRHVYRDEADRLVDRLKDSNEHLFRAIEQRSTGCGDFKLCSRPGFIMYWLCERAAEYALLEQANMLQFQRQG